MPVLHKIVPSLCWYEHNVPLQQSETVRMMSSTLDGYTYSYVVFSSLLVQSSQLNNRWSVSAATTFNSLVLTEGYVRDQKSLHVSEFPSLWLGFARNDQICVKRPGHTLKLSSMIFKYFSDVYFFTEYFSDLDVHLF